MTSTGSKFYIVLFIYSCAGQSLNASLLSPYMDSLSESKFNNGANFAVVGSSTLPKYVPFSLNIQVMQFLHFKARTLELVTAGKNLSFTISRVSVF